jgi:hypothetical protein
MLAIACLFGSSAHAAPTARVGGAGVTLALPAGWHSWVPMAAIKPTTDPLTRVVAVSAPFTFGVGGCQIDYAFPATAVAVIILEWVPMKGLPMAKHLPARPSRFDSRTLVIHPPPFAECFNGPAGVTQFTDHGRTFSASIQVGRKASTAAVALARSVLDTLQVQSR